MIASFLRHTYPILRMFFLFLVAFAAVASCSPGVGDATVEPNGPAGPAKADPSSPDGIAAQNPNRCDDPAWAVRRVIDLSLDEKVHVAVGTQILSIQVKQIDTVFDPVRQAVRRSRVQVDVDNESVWLESGNYTLPVKVGALQIDCPVNRDYYLNTNEDRWALEKDARLRLWLADCPFFPDVAFRYPAADRRWLDNRSQAGNEPTDDYLPFLKSIYYHSGVDFGGTKGIDRIIAAVTGWVVLADGEVLPGYENTPARLENDISGFRRDVVFVQDERGWFYRYSHLHSIAPSIELGQRVWAGEPIGMLGNQGTSGGWSHLHFEIILIQPSGRWGTESAYPYLWEAYRDLMKPALLAVARPHRFGVVGEPIQLSGSKSAGFTSELVSFEWEFTDNSQDTGEDVVRVYERPGFYTERLKVTDDLGNAAYDFAVVQIVDPNIFPPFYTYMHASYSPGRELHVGDDILFSVRVFGLCGGEETWDFNDGSDVATTVSGCFPFGDYASITHAYQTPGDYIVRVERTNNRGEPSIARLWVRVLDSE